MTISVIVVEDEPEFLRRYTTAILSDPGLSLIAAATTGKAVLSVLETTPPDVLLIDLGLPDIDGVEIIRHTSARYPDADILVSTMFADDDHVLRSIDAGATGYLLKDASVERVVASIREIHDGGSPISPAIARRILLRFRNANPAPSPTATEPATGSPLSTRETEILRLVAKGLSFKEVGEQLHISSHTVVTHVKKIYRKLAVHSRGGAVYEANQLGIL